MVYLRAVRNSKRAVSVAANHGRFNTRGAMMARKYRRVYPRMWHDEAFSKLEPEEKLVAVYLLTGPQTNRIGLYVLSIPAAAEETGILEETFRERFANVRQTLNWAYCHASRVAWQPTHWRYNLPDNPNVFKSCLADLDDIPECEPKTLFLQHFEHLPQTCADILATWQKRFGNVTPNVTPQEQEQEQEQDTSGFASFWQAYPKRAGRKRGRANAERLYKKIRASDRPALMAATARYAIECNGYPKDCERFLRNDFWREYAEPAEGQTDPNRPRVLTAGELETLTPADLQG